VFSKVFKSKEVVAVVPAVEEPVVSSYMLKRESSGYSIIQIKTQGMKVISSNQVATWDILPISLSKMESMIRSDLENPKNE
jgi:hypothetical protein